MALKKKRVPMLTNKKGVSCCGNPGIPKQSKEGFLSYLISPNRVFSNDE
jgi:hypothetical protein